MAKYVIEDTTLTGIADAIRGKNGSTDTYKPADMPEAISAIETGSAGGSTENLLVKPKSIKYKRIDAYGKYANTLYAATNVSMAKYYWYRSNNTNIYWEACNISTAFVEGHTYRMSAWVWHDGSSSNEPITFHQDFVFINSNTSVPNPLTEITTTPQLLTITFTYATDTAYGTAFYMYPVASENQVRMTPLIVEDLSSPENTEAIPV